jgi:hypothetical protein
MRNLISSVSVLYICFFGFVTATVVSCNNNSGLSDKAAASPAACTAAGQVPHIELTRAKITAECKNKETK